MGDGVNTRLAHESSACPGNPGGGHYWLVETQMKDGHVPARCKHCGEQRLLMGIGIMIGREFYRRR